MSFGFAVFGEGVFEVETQTPSIVLAPVADKDLTAPPGAPTTGDRYIVASPATGAWAGHEDDIAEWDGAAWAFSDPVAGYVVFVEDEGIQYFYDGTDWIPASAPLDHNSLQNIGVNTHVQIDAHIANLALHRQINDAGAATTDLWSASKIISEFDAIDVLIAALNSGKQPLDAALTSIAGLSVVADRILVSNGVDSFALQPITAFALTLLDDAAASNMRTTLGLGTAAVKNTGNSGDAVPVLNVTGNTFGSGAGNSLVRVDAGDGFAQLIVSHSGNGTSGGADLHFITDRAAFGDSISAATSKGWMLRAYGDAHANSNDLLLTKHDLGVSTTIFRLDHPTGVMDFLINPTAPTPTAGDSTTKLATTAFVTAALSTAGDARPFAVDTLAGLTAVTVGAAHHGIWVNRFDANSWPCPAWYRKVAANPGHGLSKQDASGQWFEIAETVIDIAMAGASYNSATGNDQAAITLAIAAARATGVRHIKLARLTRIDTPNAVVFNVDDSAVTLPGGAYAYPDFTIEIEGGIIVAGDGSTSTVWPSSIFKPTRVGHFRVLGHGSSLDYERLPWAQAKCTAKSGSAADATGAVNFTINPGYAIGSWTQLERLIHVDPVTRQMYDKSWDQKLGTDPFAQIASLGGGVYQVTQGSGTIEYRLDPDKFEVGETYLLIHDVRQTVGVNVIDCRYVELRDFHFWALGGVEGVYRSCGDIDNINFGSCYKPFSDRLMTLTAGHQGNASGVVRFWDCPHEGVGDDCTAMGGTVAEIVSITNPGNAARINLDSTNHVWRVGERLVYFDGEMNSIPGENKIATIAPVAGNARQFDITVTDTWPAGLNAGTTLGASDGDVMFNLDQMPRVVEIKRCRLGPCLGSAAILMGANMDVSDNIIRRAFLGGVRASVYNVHFQAWGPVQRCRVFGNRILDCGDAIMQSNVIANHAAVEIQCFGEFDVAVENPTEDATTPNMFELTVQANEVIGCNGSAFKMTRCEDFALIDNLIGRVCADPLDTIETEPTYHPIFIDRSANGVIAGNKAWGDNGSDRVKVINSTGIEVRENPGLAPPWSLDRRTRAQGLLVQNYDRAVAGTATAAVSGTVYFFGIEIEKGQLIGNAVFCALTAASGLTLARAGIYNVAGGAPLVQSADVDTIFNGNVGDVIVPFASNWKCPASGMYYVAVINVGTTPAQFARGTANGNLLFGVNGGALPFATMTGQTDLPASPTFGTASPIGGWIGLY